MESVIKICALALICTVAGMLIKQLRGDFSAAVKIAGSVMICGTLTVIAGPVMSEISTVFGESGATEYTSTVMRALGIAIIAQMTSEICRDCGENSTASGVELAGKIEIFILCLPLISEIIGYAGEILAMC